MIVKAKHWIKHDGVWHPTDSVFEISATDMTAMVGHVDVVETPIREDQHDTEPVKKTTGGRKKKTDTE